MTLGIIANPSRADLGEPKSCLFVLFAVHGCQASGTPQLRHHCHVVLQSKFGVDADAMQVMVKTLSKKRTRLGIGSAQQHTTVCCSGASRLSMSCIEICTSAEHVTVEASHRDIRRLLRSLHVVVHVREVIHLDATFDDGQAHGDDVLGRRAVVARADVALECILDASGSLGQEQAHGKLLLSHVRSGHVASLSLMEPA